MKYPKNYLEEIKLRLKVSQVVGKTVKLKKRGKEFIGLSPFTNEKTPSFTVSDEKRFYHILRFLQHTIFGTIGLEMEHVHSNPLWRMIFHSASIRLTFLVRCA